MKVKKQLLHKGDSLVTGMFDPIHSEGCVPILNGKSFSFGMNLSTLPDKLLISNCHLDVQPLKTQLKHVP